MSKRCLLGIAVLTVGALSLPALAQLSDFRILQPDFPRAPNGACALRWTDSNPFEEDPTSITWYYAKSPNGQDRKRVVSFFRDDFSRNFRGNWRPEGAFKADWAIRGDADRGRILRGSKGGGPCTSWAEMTGNVTVSVLVRPHGPKNHFGLGLKTQPDGSGYYLHNDGLHLKLVKRGEEETPVGDSVPLGEAATPGRWYWYELSIRNMARGMKVCDLRARIFDEKHERVLATVKSRTRCLGRREGGSITLLPPADFGELYVDPFESRWADPGEGQFTWDTTSVEPGKYYLIAELADGKTRRPVVSQFAMEVTGPREARGADR